MKTCPYCAAENHADAVVCYNCGRPFAPVSPSAGGDPYAPATDPTPTQPRRVRPASGQPGDTNPQRPAGYPAYPPPPPGGYPPARGAQSYPDPNPQATQPMPPYGGQPQQPYNGQPQQPYNGQPQQPYNGQLPPPHNGQMGYQPVYPPPPEPPVVAPTNTNRWWRVLLLGLGGLFVCACLFAAWTIVSGGASRLGGGLSTQVAQVFSLPTTAVQPTLESAAMDTPTPWPTFTFTAPPPAATAVPAATAAAATETATAPAATAVTGQPTATLTEAQRLASEKLLSIGCSTAIDSVGKLSAQLTAQPLQALDAAWRQTFSQAMADMKTNCGTLDAASPIPGKVGEVHKNLSLANEQFDQANQLWTEGIDNRDPSKLLEAAQHIGDATKYLNLAVTGLKDLVP